MMRRVRVAALVALLAAASAVPTSAYLKFGYTIAGRSVVLKWPDGRAVSYFVGSRGGGGVSAGEFREAISTANGTVMAAPVRLKEVRIGGIAMRDIEAVVLPAGRLKGTLLGMSFLRRLASFQIAGGSLILKQ